MPRFKSYWELTSRPRNVALYLPSGRRNRPITALLLPDRPIKTSWDEILVHVRNRFMRLIYPPNYAAGLWADLWCWFVRQIMRQVYGQIHENWEMTIHKMWRGWMGIIELIYDLFLIWTEHYFVMFIYLYDNSQTTCSVIIRVTRHWQTL